MIAPTTENYKELLTVKINKGHLVRKFFPNLFQTTLGSSKYLKLITALVDNLECDSTKTNFRKTTDVFAYLNIGCKNFRYKNAMSNLFKLGFTLKKDGYIHLNPLIGYSNKSRIDLTLDYYTELWPPELQLFTRTKYNQSVINLNNSTSIKKLICEDYKDKLYKDPVLGYLSTEDLYDLSFIRKDSNPLFIKESERYLLTGLRTKIQNTYTNIGRQLMEATLSNHVDMIIEQLPIFKSMNKNLYTFCRIIDYYNVIDFKLTESYKEVENNLLNQNRINIMPSITEGIITFKGD